MRHRLTLGFPCILAGSCAIALVPHLVEAFFKLGDAFLGDRQLVSGQGVGVGVLLRGMGVRRDREDARSSAPSTCQTSLWSLVPLRAPRLIARKIELRFIPVMAAAWARLSMGARVLRVCGLRAW